MLHNATENEALLTERIVEVLVFQSAGLPMLENDRIQVVSYLTAKLQEVL
jgi:hypothetical protein